MAFADLHEGVLSLFSEAQERAFESSAAALETAARARAIVIQLRANRRNRKWYASITPERKRELQASKCAWARAKWQRDPEGCRAKVRDRMRRHRARLKAGQAERGREP